MSDCWQLYKGDNREVLRTLPADSIDSLVTDPPASISLGSEKWDRYKSLQHFQDEMVDSFKEVLRVLKPGAHGFVWAQPRTSYRTAMALELAGFEVKDQFAHLFSNGWTSGSEVSRMIDKKLGAKRERVSLTSHGIQHSVPGRLTGWESGDKLMDSPVPVTEEAKRWNGWYTRVRPAMEIWWLVQKPFEGTATDQILRTGTGALNVLGATTGGKMPTNVILSHMQGCKLTPSGSICVPWCVADIVRKDTVSGWGGVLEKFGADARKDNITELEWSFDYPPFFVDSGPDTKEMDAGLDEFPLVGLNGSVGEVIHPAAQRRNFHPTTKGIRLTRHLIRLVTPSGGTVLDPFVGSGSIGCAALLEGMKFVGIEKSEEFFNLARARLTHWNKQADMEGQAEAMGGFV